MNLRDSRLYVVPISVVEQNRRTGNNDPIGMGSQGRQTTIWLRAVEVNMDAGHFLGFGSKDAPLYDLT